MLALRVYSISQRQSVNRQHYLAHIHISLGPLSAGINSLHRRKGLYTYKILWPLTPHCKLAIINTKIPSVKTLAIFSPIPREFNKCCSLVAMDDHGILKAHSIITSATFILPFDSHKVTVLQSQCHIDNCMQFPPTHAESGLSMKKMVRGETALVLKDW